MEFLRHSRKYLILPTALIVLRPVLFEVVILPERSRAGRVSGAAIELFGGTAAAVYLWRQRRRSVVRAIARAREESRACRA